MGIMVCMVLYSGKFSIGANMCDFCGLVGNREIRNSKKMIVLEKFGVWYMCISVSHTHCVTRWQLHMAS